MNLPVFGIPIFRIPAFGIPVFGIPGFGIPGFGIPVSGRVPVWVCHTFGTPAFGIPVFGIPTLGIPAFGIPTIGILVQFRHPLIRHTLDSPQNFQEHPAQRVGTRCSAVSSTQGSRQVDLSWCNKSYQRRCDDNKNRVSFAGGALGP